MTYLLDSNVFIHLVRNSAIGQEINEKLQLWTSGNSVYISAVTKGELFSFAKQVRWGKTKTDKLHQLLSPSVCIPVDGASALMNAYADIDVYSQAKHDEFPYPEAFTSRNMSKNDLWIAATAFLFGLPLITTDKDFDHLHPHLIDVVRF